MTARRPRTEPAKPRHARLISFELNRGAWLDDRAHGHANAAKSSFINTVAGPGLGPSKSRGNAGLVRYMHRGASKTADRSLQPRTSRLAGRWPGHAGRASSERQGPDEVSTFHVRVRAPLWKARTVTRCPVQLPPPKWISFSPPPTPLSNRGLQPLLRYHLRFLFATVSLRGRLH